MEISDVAKQSGIPASTLRYYEERGLIRSTGRRGLRRLFDEDVLERLGLISLGRAAGFTLDEIAAMMSEEGPRIERAALMSKADELDEKIRQMTIMRDGLGHAANCRAPNHMECPSFRRILRAAMTGRISAKGNPVGLANRKG
ncbi:MAG TPA: MerR family transcriptional regulator [Hyphomonas sp.]|nr:MerR family transcriptional regulator [Hyphomonas sp.]